MKISAGQLSAIARARTAERDPAWIESELRNGYGDALANVATAALRREIRACLARCDELGLGSPADRLSFCALDIVGFPGFRDLPQLPVLVDRYARAGDAIVLAIVTAAPPDFWNRLRKRGAAVRTERGLV